jgi:hypothetical protein
MKTILRASTLLVALGLGAAGALAQTAPSNAPPGGKGEPKAAPAPKIVPMQSAPQAGPTQAGQTQAGPQAGQLHAGSEGGNAPPAPNTGSMRPHISRPGVAGGGTMDRQREFHARPGYGVANRWGRATGYGRPYGMRAQRFTRYGENPATWSPRYRHTFVRGHGDRTLGYGYASRRYGYGPRYREYAPGPAYRVGIGGYAYRRAHAYAPRFSYYRPRVSYAYAETPFAYDLPRETYATGIFPTTSAIGLHSYDYAYTTRVRPIAAYAGATGSYAGGYPIYNRPLAPAYPTPGCDCD